MDASLAAYLALTAVLVITPGASTAVVVRHVLDGGRAAGTSAAAGIAVANGAWAAAAAFGVTAVVARVPLAFAIVRGAGAGYLAFLGMQALSRAWTLAAVTAMVEDGRAEGPAAGATAFRPGVAVNLLNPPIAMFYMVIVPSFLPPQPSPARFALLAAIHVVMAFACHIGWVLGFDRLRRAWLRPAARGSVEAVSGIALRALAARMLR